MIRTTSLVVVAAICTPCLGVNLLSNGSFDEPPLLGPPCSEDSQAVTPWLREGGGDFDKRNGTLLPAPCPRDGTDPAHATIDGEGGSGTFMSQAVTGLTPSQEYELTGFWFGGHSSMFGSLTLLATLHDGTDPNGPQLGSVFHFLNTGQSDTDWVPFHVSGTPTGSTMTVKLRAQHSGNMSWAGHFDGLELVPEPTALSLLALGSLALPRRRRRSQWRYSAG